MIVYLFLILGLRIVLRAEVGEVDLETTESVIWPEEKEDVSCAIEKDIRLETVRRIHNVADLDQDQEAMILEEAVDTTQEDHTIQEIGEAMILAAEVTEEEEAEDIGATLDLTAGGPDLHITAVEEEVETVTKMIEEAKWAQEVIALDLPIMIKKIEVEETPDHQEVIVEEMIAISAMLAEVPDHLLTEIIAEAIQEAPLILDAARTPDMRANRIKFNLTPKTTIQRKFKTQIRTLALKQTRNKNCNKQFLKRLKKTASPKLKMLNELN